MSKALSVILPKGRPAFRRTMRDAEGKPLKDDRGSERVLNFAPGHVVDLSAEEVEAVRDDIGPALQIAKLDEKEKPAPKPDGEATRKFQEETQKLREKQAKERAAEKPEFVTVAVPAGSPAGIAARQQAATARAAQPRRGDLESKDK